jgi:alkanesulfonate monooxygenase SsuD/methylene tetrahydromethanopterin reductase-like flavin-dependent oxidoreductase (luciferase family)
VTRSGEIEVHRARVWSRPETPPPLLGAAVTAETAAWVAGWADGLATVAQPRDVLAKVLDAYDRAGGRGPRVLQVHVALDDTEEAALDDVRDQWRHSVIPQSLWDIEQPEDFDALAGDPTDDQLRAGALVSDDPAALAKRIADLVELGFDRVYIHGIAVDQQDFLRRAEHDLLPALRSVL